MDTGYFKCLNISTYPIKNFFHVRKEFVADEVAFIADEIQDITHFHSFFVIVCSVVSFFVLYKRCQEGFCLLDILLVK